MTPRPNPSKTKLSSDALRVYHHLKIRWNNGERPVKASYIQLARACFQSSQARKESLQRRAMAAVSRLVSAGFIQKYPDYDGTHVWGNNYELGEEE